MYIIRHIKYIKMKHMQYFVLFRSFMLYLWNKINTIPFNLHRKLLMSFWSTKNHLIFYLITGSTSQQVYATDDIVSSVQVCITWIKWYVKSQVFRQRWSRWCASLNGNVYIYIFIFILVPQDLWFELCCLKIHKPKHKTAARREAKTYRILWTEIKKLCM